MLSFQLVPPLPPGKAGDSGVFGPSSAVWRISRERVLLLAGIPMLLLQFAHPLVAAGLHKQGSFERDALKRMTGTVAALLMVAFGDTAQVYRATGAVSKQHAAVKGTLPNDEGIWQQGTAYDATDPMLALWVYATLIETGLDIHSAFVHELTFDDRASYYDGSAPFCPLFGVTDAVRPKSYEAFLVYYRDVIDRQLVVGPPAASLAASLFRVKPWGIPISPPVKALSGTLLPPQLASEYGIVPGWGYAASFEVLQRITKAMLPHTHPRLRFWPHYQTALNRVQPV